MTERRMFANGLRPSAQARIQGIRAAALVGLTLLAIPPMELLAQGGKSRKGGEIESFAAKVTEIEKKGKAQRLVVEKEAGGSLDLLVTPKVKVAVTGKGDQSLFQSRAWVSSESLVLVNNELFGHQFTVHYGDAPPAQCRPDPKASDVYLMAGQILTASEEALTVNCGQGREHVKVAFEKGAAVEIAVSSNKPEFIKVGMALELEGATYNTRFIPSSLTIALEKPLTADEVQTILGEKKPARSKPSANGRGAKRLPRKNTTIEPVDGDPIGTASDPFGVLGDKGDKKDSKANGDKAGDKAAPEKKDAGKPRGKS
jgi:hypothetical protein